MQYMNFFDDAYYINLDYRIDRKESFEFESKKIGLIANRYPGILYSENDFPEKIKEYYENALDKNTFQWEESKKKKCAELGCAYSHVGIIKEAKAKNLKNVLIFEDDCVFLDSWNENIQDIINEIISFDNNWDLIYFGGAIPGSINFNQNKKLTEINGGIYCLHAYAVNSRFYDKILSYNPLDCTDTHIDIMLMNIPGKNYLPKNIMAVQKGNIFSDITFRVTSSENETELKKMWDKNL